MKDYYLFKSGRLKRKEQSLMFVYKENDILKRRPIPIHDVDSIYIFGELDLNSKLINFLSQNKIMIHFYNYYGYYTGSFYPREYLQAGEVTVRQVEFYLDKIKRLDIAKELVRGSIHGIKQNLKRYIENDDQIFEKLKGLYESIDEQRSISSLMGVEGNSRDLYYASFNKIIKQEIEFVKRVKHPPDNMINALISFMNSLVYTHVLKQIYRTQLNPTISYLHEPFYRRYSLALDIAEIFKPILADRIIFSLLNNNQLKMSHFDKDVNYAYLLDEGRKIVVQALDDKLNETIQHKQLKKKVSYNRLIRLESYKLIKHLIGEKTYNSLKFWW